MARTKSFDPEVAVGRALELFWRDGYDGTSTQALTERLGLNKSSLYGTFGSKRELYLRALDRYAPDGARELERALGEGGELRVRLRRGLLAIVDEDLDPQRARGCFAGNTAAELGSGDPAIRRRVDAALGAVRAVLRDELIAGRDAGELAPDADVEALAAFLTTALQGLRVVAKGTADRRVVEQSLDVALAAL